MFLSDAIFGAFLGLTAFSFRSIAKAATGEAEPLPAELSKKIVQLHAALVALRQPPVVSTPSPLSRSKQLRMGKKTPFLHYYFA